MRSSKAAYTNKHTVITINSAMMRSGFLAVSHQRFFNTPIDPLLASKGGPDKPLEPGHL